MRFSQRARRPAGAAALALLWAAGGSPAAAAVKSAVANGFEVENRVVVAASPAAVYAMLGRPALWWDPAHTFSHDACNLSLDLRAGGCFCERLPKSGGSVQHMRIVYADPGAVLRLQGGIGPLQGEGVTGSLTFTLKPAPHGTEIVMDYIVGGYLRTGGDNWAVVDRVLREQLEHLAARLGRGR